MIAQSFRFSFLRESEWGQFFFSGLCLLFLFLSDIAGMLLKSTGSFLESGLQESCAEFWTSADDSSASDEIRLKLHFLSSPISDFM